MAEKMNTKKSLAFIVELLGLFILLIMVIVIVTQVFVMSRSQSLRAGNLTEAVVLAENTAEVASLSPDTAEFVRRASQMDNVTEAAFEDEGDEDIIGIIMDNDYSLLVSRQTEDTAAGIYAEDVIDVYFNDPDMAGEPLYTLRTGNYFDNQGGED
jgi:hypothetical protein